MMKRKMLRKETNMGTEGSYKGGQMERISPRQFQRMIMIELFSTTSLILPALVVRFSGKNGLAPLLAGSGMALLLAVYYLWISEKWETGYSREIILQNGVWGSSIYMILYCLRFFVHGLLLITIFTALIREVLLPEQSTGLILLPVLLLTFYATGKNLSSRARTLEFLFYYIFAPLLLVVILALFQVKYQTLPSMLWGGEKGMGQASFASYGILLTYTALEFILFLGPVSGRRKQEKGIRLGRACMFVILFNFMIYIVTVGMFGTVRTGEKLWSALYIMQNVRIPGHFLERLDILFLAFWIFSIFALFSGYLFYSESIVKQWRYQLRGEERPGKRIYAVLFLAAIFLLTIWQPDPEKMLNIFGGYMMWIDFPLSVLLPLILHLKTRSRQGENAGNSTKTRKKRIKQEIVKENKRKAVFGIFLCLFCLFLFTGCESRADIEDKNYVLALGIDEGKKDKLCVIYGTADFDQPAGEGEGGDSQEGEAVSYEADSLSDAENKDRKTDEKRLDYGHLKAILFSEELVNNQELWDEITKELEGKSNLAGTVFVFQVEGDVKKCMGLEKYLGTTMGDYLERMMTNHKKDGIEEYTLGELLRDKAEGEEIKIPKLKMSKKKIILD